MAKTVAAGDARVADARSEVVREDLSGRDRMSWNVLFSWGGHLVFVAAGFVMPRVIDHQIGQAGLGVWDFGWSVVSYFSMAEVGIGPAVNRYVAKHRAEGDTAALNVTASSVLCVQLLIAALVTILTGLAAACVPWLLRAGMRELVGDAQVVVLCLGAGLAVQMALGVFRGVITGCHRWGLHNGLNAGCYAVTVAGMLLALGIGSGLRGLAVAHLLGTIGTEGARAAVAFRVYPDLRLRWRYVEWARARALLTFGGKVLVWLVASLISYQTTSVLIVAFAGVGVLAVYSRPMALVRQVGAFVDKFGHVLMPTASSMQAAGRPGEVRELLVTATRYSVAIALPPVLLLTVFGGPLLRLWMGPQYEESTLMAVVALGHLTSIGQSPLFTILGGLDRHGRPALIALAASVVTVSLALLTLGPLGWGLIGAAIAITVPGTIVYGLLIPVYACRQLGLGVGEYFAGVWRRPLLCVAPFGVCLVASRLLYAESPVLALLAGGASGGAALLVTYWRWLMPNQIQTLVRARLNGLVGSSGWLRA